MQERLGEKGLRENKLKIKIEILSLTISLIYYKISYTMCLTVLKGTMFKLYINISPILISLTRQFMPVECSGKREVSAMQRKIKKLAKFFKKIIFVLCIVVSININMNLSLNVENAGQG